MSLHGNKIMMRMSREPQFQISSAPLLKFEIAVVLELFEVTSNKRRKTAVWVKMKMDKKVRREE